MGVVGRVEEFSQRKQAAGRAGRTRWNHCRALQQIAAWLDSQGLTKAIVQPADPGRFV